ncbi:MAG: hypothetical protein MJE77_05780 [Proteobacteria bacterium]|nr:hypothetical protein [Pseudomonadota bacterium]
MRRAIATGPPSGDALKAVAADDAEPPPAGRALATCMPRDPQSAARQPRFAYQLLAEVSARVVHPSAQVGRVVTAGSYE